MGSIITIYDVTDIGTVFKEILPFLVGLVRCLWKCFSRNDINIMMVVRKRLQITLPLKIAPSISAVGGNDMYSLKMSTIIFVELKTIFITSAFVINL
jgi:hypothetical protein